MLPKRITDHPGRVLQRDFLAPKKIRQSELARAINISTTHISQVISGERSVTAETAWLLSAYFGNSPEFWMKLQMNHDLTKARVNSKKAISAVRRRRKTVPA